MATVLPPPSKRQKTAAAARAREQQDVSDPIPSGNVKIQFVDYSTGQSTVPPVVVALQHVTVKNLGVLLNSLQGIEEASDRIRYQFFLERRKSPGDEDAQHAMADEALGDGADISHTLTQRGTATTDEGPRFKYMPQAVFSVKAVSRCSAAISGHGEAILAIQFSPISSSTMATGSGDSTARIWDTDTGTPIWTLKGHTSWVLAVSYSPDGSLLATGSYDNSVRLWDPKTGKALGNALKGHTKYVTTLAWEPYHLQEPGRPRVASSSKDTTVRIWDAIGKRADFVLSGHKDTVTCVRWGGTGQIYTASRDRTIKIWNASTGTLVHTLSAHAHWVNHLALSTDVVIRTAYHDHTGKIPPTDAEKLAKAKERFIEAATINGKVVERLVSASEDCKIYLWSPMESSPTKPMARLDGHQKGVNHVTFSSDGKLIASCGFDNVVKLWNARDGKWINTLRGHVAPVYQCCFSPDSRFLVSSSKDTTLKAWDVRTGKIAVDLPGHKDEVYAVDWSPTDGGAVGSGGRDKQVRVWKH